MEIWSVIREEHHRLQAVVGALECEPDDDLIVRGRQELIAHIRAEEETFDRALLSYGGFEKAVAEVHQKNRKLLALCGELAGTARAGWPSVLKSIEAALSGHIETQTKILPVAEHTFPRHAAERVKHEFERAKDALLEEASKGDTVSPEEIPLSPAGAALVTDASPEKSHVLQRVLRQEHESLFVCETAIDLLKHSENRSLVGENAEAHLQTTREIKTLLGGARKSYAGKVAGWTKIYAAAFLGDKAILKAVRSTEEKSRLAYERMLRDGRSAGSIRPLLEGLVATGHRHENLIDRGIASMEKAEEIVE